MKNLAIINDIYKRDSSILNLNKVKIYKSRWSYRVSFLSMLILLIVVSIFELYLSIEAKYTIIFAGPLLLLFCLFVGLFLFFSDKCEKDVLINHFNFTSNDINLLGDPKKCLRYALFIDGLIKNDMYNVRSVSNAINEIKTELYIERVENFLNHPISALLIGFMSAILLKRVGNVNSHTALVCCGVIGLLILLGNYIFSDERKGRLIRINQYLERIQFELQNSAIV